MWFCSSKMELSFRICHRRFRYANLFAYFYFKAALELEEFHKNCTLKQNWEQPFKKVKNLTLILSISLLSIIGFFLMFINLVNINPI